jgi:glycosyltransferase involved in cell wall biosynthesis
MHAAETEIIADLDNSILPNPAVSVIISCYKYGREAIEAIESVSAQDEPSVDVILIDDASPDDSVCIIMDWINRQSTLGAIRRILLKRHIKNQGLSQTRNTAIHSVETPFTFVLDADNQIFPHAVSRLREAIEVSGFPAAYSLIEMFGEEAGLMGKSVWIPEKFCYGNYIDAMAMFRTSLLHEIGGYREMPHKFGWEDFDLWCSMVDRDYKACYVPEILCRYRVHGQSMLNSITRRYVSKSMSAVRKDLEQHHNMKFFF